MADGRTIADLTYKQSLPLEMKKMLSKDRVRQWIQEFGEDGTFISTSGGKDSTVLKHFITEYCGYSDVKSVFVNTGLEYESVKRRGIEMADEVLHPEMNFAQVITRYGYPVISKKVAHDIRQIKKNPQTSCYLKYYDGSMKGKSLFDRHNYAFLIDAPFRISEKCCDVMKKRPIHEYQKRNGQPKAFTGIMASESFDRRKAWMQYGCNAFQANEPKSHPLMLWTEQDILKYIKEYGLPIADVYKDIVYQGDDGMLYPDDPFDIGMPLTTTGEKRTGCVFCMFGITVDTERFVRLKQIEPRKYEFVMRGGDLTKAVCGYRIKGD